MAQTNGAAGSSGKRDIKSHLLFEIATEVANRGMGNMIASLNDSNIKYSRWYLFRLKIQSSSYDSRIWRTIHPHWSPQPRIGQ